MNLDWLQVSIAPEAGAFIAQIVATLVLVVILRIFLWNPIKEFGTKRREYIKSQYDDAENLKHETEQFILEAEAKKNEIYNQADEIISNSKKEGEAIKAKAIENAKFEADRKILRADDEIKEAKVKAKEELKDYSADLATLIASKLVTNNVTKEDQDALIAEALNEIK